MTFSRLCHRRTVAVYASTCAGFTMVEMLIVIALMGAALTLAAPVLDTLVQNRDLDGQTGLVADSLRQAQTAAMTGLGDGAYGVHFASDGFTYFTGTSYNAADPDNVVHGFSGFVSIIDVTLTDSGTDVVYRDHHGVPEESGSITLTEPGGRTTLVVVGEAGLIETQ